MTDSKLCRKQFFEGNILNFVLTLISVVIGVFSELLVAFIVQYVIESMEYKDIEKFKIALFITVIAIVASITMNLMQKTFRNRYLKKGLSQFKYYIFGKLLDKPIGSFGDSDSARFISAFSNDINSIEANYLVGNIGLFNNIMSFTGALVSMIIINGKLSVVVTAVMIVPFLFALLYGRTLTAKEKQTSSKNADFVDQVKDILNGFIVIKSFKAEKEVLKIFEKNNNTLEEVKRKRRETNDIVGIISGGSSLFVLIITVLIGTYFSFKGEMSIGGVLAFVQLLNNMLNPVKNIIPLISNRRAAIALIDKLADRIKPEANVTVKEDIKDFCSSIEFKDVHFSYNKDDEEILHGINLKFEKGKSYALVGASGSGKSTILRLLMGHFSNYQGSITIDGKELKRISMDSLYEIVSVIQQNVFLFNSTIKDNITMFKNFNEDDYITAVENAGLAGLISDKGEYYQCGEQGSNLSGGEKQRVSIARCLIRNTPVLMMDEATAALDNATAWEVDNAILDIENLTRIMVTHRFEEGTLKKYDEIIAVQNGRIVEQGSFDELMDKKGYFYSLYNVSCNL